MESSNESFDKVLLKAQKLGYAEPQIKLDLNGFDAFAKVRILSTCLLMLRYQKISVLWKEFKILI